MTKEKKERWLDLVLFGVFWGALIALLLSVGGCACFEQSRVEARADYHVLARDASVSIVAVGYTKGSE